MSRLALAVLISGNGSNLQALIDAASAGQIDCRAVAVISNVPDAFGLERARRAGIPAHVVVQGDYPNREAFESRLVEVLDSSGAELVALAGFMRVLGKVMVERYSHCMLNVHPSLLPRYPGLDTHQRVLDAGEHEHGASIHFVTAELDAGPVIVQGRVPVRPDDDAASLAARVHGVEHRIYPAAVGWYAAGRLALRDGSAWLDGKRLRDPVQM